MTGRKDEYTYNCGCRAGSNYTIFSFNITSCQYWMYCLIDGCSRLLGRIGFSGLRKTKTRDKDLAKR